MVDVVNIIGISASACTAIAAMPQLLKLLKEKKADDISLIMLLTLISGLGLWVAYGFMKSDWIIIISNSLSLLLNATVLILTIRFKK